MPLPVNRRVSDSLTGHIRGMIQMHDCAAQVRGLVASRCGLTFLNRQSTRGDGACHLCVDATGRTLLVANYGSGSVAALPIGADGSLGEPSDFFQHEGRSVDAERQEGPHAHSITLDGANRHALVADLGLDQILLYELDAVYGSNRGHDSIVTFAINPGDGTLTYVGNEPSRGKTAQNFVIDPSGELLLVANLDSDTVVPFRRRRGESRRCAPVRTRSSRR